MIDENLIAELVRRKVVTETFRRLPPAKKEKLYSAALHIFAKYGYDGMAIDQYCANAKISKGSFFQYFPSKTHLLEFALLLFDNNLREVSKNLRESETAVMAKDRLLQLILALGGRDVLQAVEKKFYLFAVNSLHHSAVAVEGMQLERHLYDFISEVIRRAEETREVRSDYATEVTIRFTARTIDGILTDFFLSGKIPDRETTVPLIDYLFEGIKNQ